MTHAQLTRAINLSPQQKTILAHLMNKGSISNVESLIVYNISRLSDVILKLRRKGFSVETDVRNDPRGHKYSRYSLAA
jgi:DNA-binding MarR family transcriptional regulator